MAVLQTSVPAPFALKNIASQFPMDGPDTAPATLPDGRYLKYLSRNEEEVPVLSTKAEQEFSGKPRLNPFISN